jgi:hypothetical protein
VLRPTPNSVANARELQCDAFFGDSVHCRIDDLLDRFSAYKLRAARARRIFKDAVQTALKKS